jgi:hypothetical protein
VTAAAAEPIAAPTPAADLIREAVLALEVDGRVTPEAVLEAAADPASPLHDHFEWDDAAAAQQHRLEQARSLIRSVRVQITTETRVVSTVHYVRDPSVSSGEQGYVSVTRLRSEPETARAMLRMELQRVQSCLSRAEELADALGLRPQVAAMGKRVESLRRKVDAVAEARA